MAPPSSYDSQKTDPNSIYFYNPSLAASILFTLLYIFPFFYHFYLTVIAARQSGTGASTKYRKTGYFVPLLIGAGFEIAGYALRCASVEQTDSIPLYAVSQTLIVVSPVFVCASLYLVIGRLIRRESANDTKRKNRILCISSKWLPRLFISSDCFSFLLQGSGSGIASSNNWEGTTKNIGIDVIIGGLVLQVVTFTFFLVITVIFHRRILSQQRAFQAVGTTGGVRSSRGNVNTEKDFDSGVLVVIRGIYISGFFILVRSVYRVVDFSLGIPSYTFDNEWPLYVLEAVPMLTALTVLGVFHPGKWLSQPLLSNKALRLENRNIEDHTRSGSELE